MLPRGSILGDLRITEVLIEYDGPQMFVCSDEIGRIFLCVHVVPTKMLDNWLYVQVTLTRLADVKLGDITLREAFSKPEAGNAFLVSFDAAGRSEVDLLAPQDINEAWLPEVGERLGETLRQEIAESLSQDYSDLEAIFTAELPSELRNPSPMWELDPIVMRFLKAHRTPVAEVARRTGRSVVDLIIHREGMRTDLPVVALGNLLLATQRVVDGLVPVIASSGRGSQRPSARLDAIAFFPSSFGIRIDSHDASLFTQPSIVAALERLVVLCSTVSDTSALRKLLIEFGPKAALQFRSFAQAVTNSNGSLTLEVGTPGEEDSSTASVSRAQVSNLLEFLKNEASQFVESVDFRGRLVGVSLKTKFFRLENDEDNTNVSGRISDEFLAYMNGKTIGVIYQARLNAITDLNESTGEERTRYILLSMDAG